MHTLIVLLAACSGRIPDHEEPPLPSPAPSSPVAYEVDPEHQGLKVELTDAAPANTPVERVTVAPATPLGPKEIDALLARVGPLEGADGDRTPFAIRPGSKPPPLPGSDVSAPFPPPATLPVVEVPKGPVKVLRSSPEGDVPLAPNVSITFDRAMVAVTSQAEAAKTVPAKLEPQPPGTWRWLGTRTLLFDPEPRLPMATSYTVEVPAGTASATGDTLAQAVRFTFATPPVTLRESWPSNGPHGLEPLVALKFDQKVDPAALLPFVELGGGPAVKLRLATEAERAEATDDGLESRLASDEADRFVVYKPTEPLARETSYTVRIRSGAPSAEGPRTPTSDQWSSFYTYAPLKIVEHHCSWDDRCPPTTPWMIRFDNPLAAETFDPNTVSVEPAVPGLSVQAYGDTLQLSGAFVGRTTYTVKVPATIADTFGQTLGADEDIVFRVGPAEKSLEASGDTLVTLDPAGTVLPIWSTNHAALKVTIHAVTPADWPAWLAWMDAFDYDDARPKRLPGTQVFQGTVSPATEPDHKVETALDFAPYCKEGSGQFVVLVEPTVQPRDRWNRQYVWKWVQVTDIGLTAFVDRTQLVGWATDLATGDAASGVSLEVRGAAAVSTGADGLAAVPLPTEPGTGPNVLVARRGADTAILPEHNYSYGSTSWIRWTDLDQLRWYVTDDRGLYRPGENARVKGWLRRWELGPTGDIGPLGQTGGKIDWRLVDPQGNEIGKGNAPIGALGGFDLDLAIPAQANLGTASLYLTAQGVGTLDGLTTQHPLRIEEFRRPEFEVTSKGDADHHTLGEKGQVDLAAAYYAGGGLPNADVSWTVYAKPTSYVPPGWAEWSFGTWTPWWSSWNQPGDQPWEQPVGTFASKTDGSGAQHLGIHFVSLNPPRPMSVRAEGTVFDVNRQAWTSSTTMVLHPSRAYVGLKTAKSFVEKGAPIDVELAIVDIDGKPVDTTAEVTLARMEWGRADGKYGEVAIDPESCAADTDGTGLARCSFTTVRGGNYRVLATVRDAEGRANESELRVWVSGAEVAPAREVTMETVTLVPESKDPRPGQTARILVQAPFFPAEGVLTLRRSGLVSTERFTMDGPTTTLEVPIVDAHVPDLTVQVNLVGAASRADDDGKPLPDAPKRVAHAMGTITFRVPPLSRTLTVAVAPAGSAVAPGSTTEIAVTVTRPDGTPVSGAEVALLVADESVLALTGYQLPDPIEVFYAARGPGVTDYHLRSSIALANATTLPTAGPMGVSTGAVGGLGYRGMGPGGGGEADGAMPAMELAASAAPMKSDVAKRSSRAEAKEEQSRSSAAPSEPDSGGAIAMRTDFSALALFAPSVRTDAAGRASVPLKLPDSLTRYRIMAVAVDTERSFGSADGAITARLPLMVRPSAPRFLNFGDQMELPVVLQNQTDAPMQVDVAVRASNVRFVDAIGPSLPDLPDVALSTAGQRVTVPANDRVEVRFPAATLMAGTARFQVVGAVGTVSDAATLAIPVWTPATTEAFATYGEIDGKKGEKPGIVQPVQAPPGSWPQFGGLEVTASSTQLQALTDAVLYLQSYPFDCNEQLASRVLAIASLRDVLSAFDAEGLPPTPELEAQVASDLERLANRQHWNGGFSFWRKGDEPWPFLSIHVANAFARAKAKGYTVPTDAWDRSAAHLADIESHIPAIYSQESKWFLRAYALDVRRRMGSPDVRKARALYKEAGTKLDIDGLAFLLPTLHEAGATAEVDTILRHLGNNTTESAGTAHFVTSYSDGAYVLLHSDRRADGIVLEALIETNASSSGKPSGADSDLVAKVVRGLLAHKTKGRWGNTQENAFVLLALDRYFRVYEKETPDFVARIWLGDGYVGDHTFEGRTTERAHFEVPMGTLTETAAPQPLTVVRDGDAGRLYYRIGLRYAPKDLRLQPADYGFAVQRRYEAIDDPADVRQDPDGTWHIAAGARVRVQLSMATEMRRYHVALVDPLPAGLEAQNPVLATTGTLPTTTEAPKYGWWDRSWWEHENLRDERVEAFTSLLWAGVYEYAYVARATTPGRFVVPPTRAEEMYMPETFGRAGTDIVVVE